MPVATPIEVPPPGQVQVTAVGATLSNRWGRLRSFTGGSMTTPLTQSSGVFLGQPDSGKSSLIQSCPTGEIMNLDLTTAPAVLRAGLWPGVRNGQAVGDDGNPMILSWQKILDRVALLVDMARLNEPRPTTVFFDTMGSAIRLAKQWSIELALHNDTVSKDGRAMWDRVHESIIKVHTDLRNAGYGVFWNIHIVNAKIPLGEDRFVFQPELASPITAGFWAKLYPLFEMVLVAKSPTEEVTEIVEIPVTIRGETKIEKKPITSSKRIWFLTNSDPDYLGLTKARVSKPLPDRILIPKETGWDTLEKVYAEHTRG